MKVSELYGILENIAPFDLQEKWDNSGLQVGSFEDEFEEIYVSLDLDSKLVEDAKENSLFITHHPLIFDGLKSVDPTKYPSNLIYKMIKKDIKLISMHTNADKAFLNRYVVEEVLGYSITSVDEFLVDFVVNKSFDEFYQEISQKLSIEKPRAVKTKEFINSASICTGSGGSLLSQIKTDCFLTGDIKYHTALEAKENSITLIDIEHYQSEVHFAKALQKLLKDKGIDAIIAHSSNPYTTI